MYDQKKLERLAGMLGVSVRRLEKALSTTKTRLTKIVQMASSGPEIKALIDDTESTEPTTAQAKIAGYERWLILEPGNAEATNKLQELRSQVEMASTRARSATTVDATLLAYINAPEGTVAEKIAIERALELLP